MKSLTPTNNARLTPTREHAGARVLWVHWMSVKPAQEGYVREFSADGRMVRISKTDRPKDAGAWHEVRELRIVAVLDESKKPDFSPEDDR